MLIGEKHHPMGNQKPSVISVATRFCVNSICFSCPSKNISNSKKIPSTCVKPAFTFRPWDTRGSGRPDFTLASVAISLCPPKQIEGVPDCRTVRDRGSQGPTPYRNEERNMEFPRKGKIQKKRRSERGKQTSPNWQNLTQSVTWSQKQPRSQTFYLRNLAEWIRMPDQS